MAELLYLVGDATDVSERPAIIAHICNDRGAWGRGFTRALSRRWPAAAEGFREWVRLGSDCSPPYELGFVQYVTVSDGLWVANMVAQSGLGRANRPIRYKSLEDCLRDLGGMAATAGASVHMPRIGTGLAGGDWRRIEPLILETIVDCGVPVTVYDLG